MIRRRTLRDDLYDELLERILDGSLPPGTTLRDADLAAELNVSRTPIREAVLQLTHEGFVEMDPNRWTRVAQPSWQTVTTWYEIMAALEALAAEKAAATIEPSAIDALVRHTDDLDIAIESEDPLRARQADDNFHRVIVDAANRADLMRIIEEHRSKLRWIDVTFFASGELRHDAVPEHREIITALRRGNAATASKLVRRNWERGIANLPAS